MDIAFIHPSYPHNEGTGSTHSATQIYKTLQEQGHNVIPYCTSDPGNSVKRYEFLNPDGFPPHTLSQLNKRVNNRLDELCKFDVVHSYLPLIPSLNKLQNSTKTVITLNSYKTVCPKMDLRYMDKQSCRENGMLRCGTCLTATSGGHAERGRIYRTISRLGNLRLVNKMSPDDLNIDRYQALSPHVKTIYNDFGYPIRQIEVIPNLVDEKFLIEHKSDFFPPYKLLFVGYLRKSKGVKMLPDVVRLLLDRVKYDIEMTVVGTGGLKNKIQRKAMRLNVDDNIDFRGFVKNNSLPDVYANHDLFVYPGLWDEPFGRVLIESLAAGTPVIGTDVGSVEEIIRGAGKVTDANPVSIAESIKSVLEHDTLKKHSLNAKKQVKLFTPDNIGPLFDKMYADIE